MNPSTTGLIRQWTAAIISSISVVILGVSLGWPSPVLIRMEQTRKPMHMSSEEVSWMVSLLYVGNLVSPIPAGYFMDKCGRKTTLLFLTILPTFSWIIIFFARQPYQLYIARFLGGCWSGTVSTITPLYLSEISEVRIRGATSTLVQMSTNLGVLIAYLLGPAVSYEMLAFWCGILPILFVVMFRFMPESPYWLLMKEKHVEAVKSLSWLRGFKNEDSIADELEQLEMAVEKNKNDPKTVKDLFSSSGNRKALLIVEALSLLQRMSGISALMAYTSTTLPPKNIGFLGINDCVTVMGVVWFVSVFIALSLVDKLGRKPLLLASSIGCGIAMFAAGLWFFLHSKTDLNVERYHWIPFASFLFYGVFFCFGLGPIASTVQGEVFPSNTRGIASGITSMVLAATSFVMNKIYHGLAREIGMYVNYWIFSAACFIATIFVLTVFVETKGKSFYQIQLELNKEFSIEPTSKEQSSKSMKQEAY